MDDLGYGAAAPFFIFPSEAAVWDGPRSHPAAQKVEDAYVYKICGYSRTRYLRDTDNQGISGDYANGNDYIRNITTYRFVRTEPDESNLTQNAGERLKSFMKKNKKAQGNKMDGRPLFGAVFSCEKEGTGNISFICSRHTD
ncbi:MAG: hypothetical protein ACLUIQ_05265 [Dialister invisus]